MTLLIRNLSQIATPLGRGGVRGRAMRALAVYDNAVIVVRDGRFAFVGRESEIDPDLRSSIDVDFDARGATAVPGFIDSHTHLPFAGYRETEFNRRLQGETYEQIAASGGGIASSVHATRRASEQELVDNILVRARTMARYGTTTAEAKSGYGLSVEGEMKQLRAIRDANEQSPVRLIATCLAAHDFPPEGRSSATARRGYVSTVIGEILPAVAEEKLAIFCDVFVERGVFTNEEGDAVLRAGAALGLIPRMHADELSDTAGAALAASLGCASADHLMQISDAGIAALAASNTVANLLPATSFFLMSDRYAPARQLIDAGAIVSLSTDCNPGTSMTESMPMVMQLATLQMKMTVEESLTAATLNGAASLQIAHETGSIELGKRGDLVLLDAPNYLHLVYHFGVNLVTRTMRDGQWVL
ncbi:MAG: imidazolonepropionase [Acidobacteria bacterium]|nr:imidazolonepropionase [Acidobacteriota bacterium]MBV9070355.1 imidazolonepropionase [Acidobacteriota bacterium]MBV9184770.1 imidazolonepropionase [Acidobacteriota bacterium]